MKRSVAEVCASPGWLLL